VTLYTAGGCHLCERARETLDAEGVTYREVDIGGDPALEAAYREWLPVVEIDGERAFVYYVQPDGFRRRLARAQSRLQRGGS
jgi:glutaredoxin